MIHSLNTLSLLGQILRQAGADYIDGKEKIEKWKQEYLEKKKILNNLKGNEKDKLRLTMYRLEEKMNIFWCAEEFWFDIDEFGESPADAFWEKWCLEWAGWDLNGFRRMVKDGRMLLIAPQGDKNADNTGTEQMVGQEVLLNRGDWKRGELGGSGNGGAFRTSSGDCPASLGKAVELAGCVC